MVNKYIGDAVMAVFGAPKAYADHPRRALAAGWHGPGSGRVYAMDAREVPGRGLPDFAIGVGIHTGTCVVGDVGSVKRTEFTAIGDTVNAASRLEGVTKDLGVPLVASSVTVHAAGRRSARPAGNSQGEGREEAIEVYEITGLGDSHRSQGNGGGQAPEASRDGTRAGRNRADAGAGRPRVNISRTAAALML